MSAKTINTKVDHIIVAIDNGKNNMKAKLGKTRLCYNNKFSLDFSDASFIGDNTHNVIFGKQRYTIGANATRSDTNEGKASEIQITQALTAIANLVGPENKLPIYLMYGESVDKYLNTTHKAELKSLLEKKHIINVDGVEHTLNIQFAQILSEGLGFVLQDLKKYKGYQYVCDIGGGTINWITIYNGRPIPEMSRSFPLGVNNIAAKAIMKLKRNDEYSTTDDKLIMQFLTERETCPNQELLTILDNLLLEQLYQLDEELGKYSINIHDILKTYPVHFIGGGSKLLKKQIEKMYTTDLHLDESLVAEDAIYANVEGYYKFGVEIYGTALVE